MYMELQHTLDVKERKTNSSIFYMYYDDMWENIDNTWRIPPEVVRSNQGITYFKAFRHNMWIKAKRDPTKEWLQLRYCVIVEEMQWAMKY
jgi:hypothetical protein